MNNNKIYEEVNNENLCVICLEDLNEDIMDVCHKCNVKCHIKCLYDWYKKNNEEICPICLQTEEYYLNLLKNNKSDIYNINNNNENINNNIENDIENDIDNNIDNNIEDDENYVIVYDPNKRLHTCFAVCFFMGIISIIMISNM